MTRKFILPPPCQLIIQILSSVVLLSLTFQANAGWVSAGGGELFGNAHNPWFLRNITEVNYCVDVAPASVSLEKTKIQSLIGDAIQYWKGEFFKASQSLNPGQFSLATQKFNEVDCSDSSVRLHFKIGFETLTTDEVTFLGNPLDYIGVSIRTDYDSDLRGKGFIFIASDIGPKSYHGGTDSNLIAKAWQKPQLLKYALLHELGHVFGMPHTGSGIMAEPFLEQMLSVSLADNFVRTSIPSFFAVDDSIEICQDSGIGANGLVFFSAPATDTCLRLSRQDSTRWGISSRKNKTSQDVTNLGQLIATGIQITDLKPHPAVVLQLMGNTAVFKPEETFFRSFMFGPMLTDYGAQGNFVPTSGSSKPVYVRIGPDSMLIQAAVNSKIQNIFAYSSPIGILLLQNPTPH